MLLTLIERSNSYLQCYVYHEQLQQDMATDMFRLRTALGDSSTFILPPEDKLLIPPFL